MAIRGTILSAEQARRVGRVVRAYERSIPDRMGTRIGPLERRIPNQLFAVKVTIDGGSAGSSSTTCSWTYTVTTLSGRELGTALTPKKRRLANVSYTATPADTIGLAYFDEAGELQLFDANELEAMEDCE